MRKEIIRHIKAWAIPFLGGVALTACVTDNLKPEGEENVDAPCIELTFDSNDTETRALTDKKTPFTPAERSMETVDLFFYQAGSDVNTGKPGKVASLKDKKHGDIQRLSFSNEDARVLFGESWKESGGSCIVYAVVNVTEADFTNWGIKKEEATVSDLRTIKATTEGFAGVFKNFAMFTKAPGGDVVTYDPATKKAFGTVKLKNLAAKIDVFVKFAEIPADDEKTWQVATSSGIPTAEVHILNGVKAVKLNGFDKSVIKDEDYYSIRIDDDEKDRRSIGKMAETDPFYDKENGWIWATAEPYYSYPNSWEDNPLEQHRTSLLLKVDWTTADDPEVVGDNDVFSAYYSVPIDLEGNKLESNRYYRLKLNINSLGGANFGDPLVIEPTIEVLDWGHAELEADIRKLRYLEITQKQLDRDGMEYTAVMNGNDGLVTIPFKSSHAAEIRDITIEYMTFDGADTKDNGKDMQYLAAGKSKTATLNVSAFSKSLAELEGNNYQCAYIDNVRHTITVKHPIGAPTPDKESSPSYYTPNTEGKYIYISYVITMHLKHEDTNQTFDDDKITIVHHPSIYVEGEVNTCFNFSWNSVFQGDDDAKDRHPVGAAQRVFGYTRVNNEKHDNARFGGLAGIAKANVTLSPSEWFDKSSDLPIMYIITATQLDEESQKLKLHIKDPRVMVDEHAGLQDSKYPWVAAPHFENGDFDKESHTLQYYYPTSDSRAEETMYAISPQFRVASAFGVSTKELTKDEAKRRCASYCEFGYPAGRWRVPTVGELKFISMLSNRGLIPRLFEVNKDYMTAQGVFRFDRQGNDSENVGANDAYTRCVYDDWYWVKDDGTPDVIKDPYNARVDNKIFIWGDKEKKSPQVQPTVQP